MSRMCLGLIDGNTAALSMCVYSYTYVYASVRIPFSKDSNVSPSMSGVIGVTWIMPLYTTWDTLMRLHVSVPKQIKNNNNRRQ